MNKQLPSATGFQKPLYVVAGGFCVLLGTAGAFLPLLPTTPFLLLASFFFVRSSPRLHAWLLRNRLFGPFLSDWNQYRGVRRRVKITAASMILLVGGVSIASGRLPYPLLLVLCALLGVGLTVVLRLRTIDKSSGGMVEIPPSPRAVLIETGDPDQSLNRPAVEFPGESTSTR
ncbi:MAG: YbaN family protein [Planctomycetota bacterium]